MNARSTRAPGGGRHGGRRPRTHKHRKTVVRKVPCLLVLAALPALYVAARLRRRREVAPL